MCHHQLLSSQCSTASCPLTPPLQFAFCFASCLSCHPCCCAATSSCPLDMPPPPYNMPPPLVHFSSWLPFICRLVVIAPPPPCIILSTPPAESIILSAPPAESMPAESRVDRTPWEGPHLKKSGSHIFYHKTHSIAFFIPLIKLDLSVKSKNS